MRTVRTLTISAAVLGAFSAAVWLAYEASSTGAASGVIWLLATVALLFLILLIAADSERRSCP